MGQGAPAERRRRRAQSRALLLAELAQCELHLSLALLAERALALLRHLRPRSSGVVEGEGRPAAGTGRVRVGRARVDAEQARAVEDMAALQHARHVERLHANAALVGGGRARPRPLESRGEACRLAQCSETKVGVDRFSFGRHVGVDGFGARHGALSGDFRR